MDSVWRNVFQINRYYPHRSSIPTCFSGYNINHETDLTKSHQTESENLADTTSNFSDCIFSSYDRSEI